LAGPPDEAGDGLALAVFTGFSWDFTAFFGASEAFVSGLALAVFRAIVECLRLAVLSETGMKHGEDVALRGISILTECGAFATEPVVSFSLETILVGDALADDKPQLAAQGVEDYRRTTAVEKVGRRLALSLIDFVLDSLVEVRLPLLDDLDQHIIAHLAVGSNAAARAEGFDVEDGSVLPPRDSPRSVFSQCETEETALLSQLG
jgi:hypothetical protein